MDETWFDTTVASVDHFWIKRRFETFRRLWRLRALQGRVAEIGCGHGLVLKQVRQSFGIVADGYELNEVALKRADPACGRLFYYNIHDRLPELRALYDAIFLFDVLEHIEEDKQFLQSVLFHLKSGGFVFVNVPADVRLYSDYDRVQGHQRRYDFEMLNRLATTTDLSVQAWSYWGAPFIPLLMLRRKMLAGLPDQEVTRRGFAAPGAVSNRLMLLWGSMEIVPNHWRGTSLMAILQKGNQG